MVVAENPTRQRDIVVFVDDQPEVLDSLRRLLRDETYEVRTTSSPDEALRWVGEGDVSVLVTDERMPTMRGTDLLERASKRSPRTVRVVLTVVIGAVLLWIPQYYPKYRIEGQFNVILTYAIAALGLNLLTGYNGQISLGHGAFYAIGAYTTAIMMDKWDIAYGWTVPIAPTRSV